QYGSLFDEIAFYKVMNRGGMMAAETEGMMPDVGGGNRTHMCAHPFNCIYVTCEGYLSPCALDSFLKLKVGDLNTSSLKDAWYGADFKRLRQRFIDGIEHMPEQCQACYQSESILANILDI
ncbi:MAG: SPASM domain-containing protein, partial [Clostridiales bacterium]|nr:SPASM domain-containing protein [Clostridiales bacterium]